MQTSLQPQQVPQRLATLRILLIRHGLSEDNLNSVWAGHRDSPLASTGIHQAKALGAALANYNLSAIYSSDLKRASRTAEEILRANRSIPPPPLVQTQSLREQNFGQAEGWNYSDAEYAMSSHGENVRTFRFPGGETVEDVNARMGVSLRRYVLPRLEALRSGQEVDEPQIIIVAHGVAIAELLRVLMDHHDSSSGNSPWPDPRETYTRVRLENTGWTMVELAVSAEENEEMSEVAGRKKSIYTRIVQQNNTDHLQGFSPVANNGNLGIIGKGSISNASGSMTNSGVNSLLAGGLASTEVSQGGQQSHGTISQSISSKTVNAYDTKYMMRELERAGTSNTFLSGSGTAAQSNAGSEGMLVPPPSLSGATPIVSSPSQSIATLQSSNASVGLGSNSSVATAPSALSDLWQSICVRILPLFNGENLKGHVEDVNDSVSSHITRTLDRGPARALENLSKDLYALCATGMLTLNARLNLQVHDDFLFLDSLTVIWTIFFMKVLPWLEACFLPLQTDVTLLSLSTGEDKPLSSLQTEPIEVRKVALIAFRDQIVLSWFGRILPLFFHVGDFDIDLLSNHQGRQNAKSQEKEEQLLYPRLMQMTNILTSILTSDEESQMALDELFRALRTGNEAFVAALNPHQHAGLASEATSKSTRSHAGNASRERRNHARHGWLPKSAAKHGNKAATDGGHESAYLSALKSPTLDDSTAYSYNSTNETDGIHHPQELHLTPNRSDDEEEEEEEEELSISDDFKNAMVFAPLQDSAIGLGFPLQDHWSEAPSPDHQMPRSTRSSSK
ncbi:hypothetical protein CBS101457_004063 [Exobasidium rhododendri]|nr:hypothetical protein CBS101457_004063 [Exobasidium rhododendri]